MRKSESPVNSTLDKLSSHYSEGIGTYTHYLGNFPSRARHIPKKDISTFLSQFEDMSEFAARQVFSDMVLANENCRAMFRERNQKLINNWFDGLIRAKEDHQREDAFQIRKKANNLRLKEKQARAAAAALKIEEKAKEKAARAAKNLANKKEKILKKLKLTNEQQVLLKQIYG